MLNTTALRQTIEELTDTKGIVWREQKLIETCRRLLDCIDDLSDRVDGLEKEIDFIYKNPK